MTHGTITRPAQAAEQRPRASRRRRFGRWLADRPRGELYAWVALVSVAFVLRIFDLGSRPFHHDESQDAYFSWVFYDRGDYHYQPILHGPLRFYLTALMYAVFGDSDFTARLAPALMGTLVVALTYLLRRHVGTIAAFAAGVMLAFGPTYLYYSRFAREDIYIAAITLGLLIAAFRFLDRPRPAGPSIIAVLVALSFATKETTFITLFVAGTFFIPYAAWQSWRASKTGGGWRDGEIVAAVRSVGWVPWAYALAAFWLVFAILFTVFLTRPSGLWDGIYDGLDYWLSQQPVGRGGEPWYFYITVLVAHEWPVLLLGALGAAWSLRHPTTLRLFLIWGFAMSLAVYSWASERFAWLVMHPLLPLILLAGIGVQVLLRHRRTAVRAAGVAAVVLGFAYLAYASYLVNAVHGANPREFLVSTQSSTDVKRVADRVVELAERAQRRGEPLSITVDTSQGATFPWAWYFRDLAPGYIDMTQPAYVPQSQVLIMTEQARAAQLPELAVYDGQRFRFRVWWVRDWARKLDPGVWWRWLTQRETWNPTGGMPEWIYVRKDAQRLP